MAKKKLRLYHYCKQKKISLTSSININQFNSKLFYKSNFLDCLNNGIFMDPIAFNKSLKEEFLNIIQIIWNELNITHVSYRRFSFQKGVFSIGNALEMYPKFWENYNYDSINYILRNSQKEALWNYAREHTENNSELEIFNMREKELNLPSGLVKVIYGLDYIDIFHFASTQINLHKYYFDVLKKINKINFACKRTTIALEKFTQIQTNYNQKEDEMKIINQSVIDGLQLRKDKLAEIFWFIFKKHLTATETECLFMLMFGTVPKKIADQSNNSLRTIEKHIANIKQKAKCSKINNVLLRIFNFELNV